MILNPEDLQRDINRLEEIEKASLRMVTQAIYDYRNEAAEIFKEEIDLVADIGEDITREALDKLGMSRIDQRLFGKIDYKRARYIFHPEYSIKQALFVDSKAEKIEGQRTATLQTSQTSMKIEQIRSGKPVSVEGKLPKILELKEQKFITTTIFVKYNYAEDGEYKKLENVTIAALPNGFLQRRYNPSATNNIWLVGRNAPSRGEEFRVRLSFEKLKSKANWRVQKIHLRPLSFDWEE